MTHVGYKPTIIALLLIATLTGCNSEESQNKFDESDFILTNEPYLYAAHQNGITVSWRTDTGDESKVLIGTEPGMYNQEVMGSPQRLGYNYQYHKVAIDGLQPGTQYYYRVVTGEQASVEHSFVTASDSSKEGIYRFVVIGDHQYAEDDRIDRLVKGAKSVLEQRFPEEGVHAASLVLNNGDQVDRSTLDDWSSTHFGKMKYLSGDLPFYTVLGNHEYYGDPGASLYYSHFDYSNIAYKQILPTTDNASEYYAFQDGRALYIMLHTETGQSGSMETGTEMVAQADWIKEVIEAAEQDDSIDWIFAVGHNPYMDERNGGGDEQELVRRVYVEELQESPKFAMYVGAHTHNYSRGTFRDHTGYHIVSGGASFDEPWSGKATFTGDYEAYYNELSGNSKDYNDVQKAQMLHNFQIVEVNQETDEIKVDTYTTGNETNPLQSPVLKDTFTLNKRTQALVAPLIEVSTASVSGDGTVEVSISGEEFAEQDSLYSTEFILAQPNALTNECEINTAEHNVKLDIENVFGTTEDENLDGIDWNQHHDIDIKTVTFGGTPQGTKDGDKSKGYALADGTYCVKARYRNQNQVWSEWSETEIIEVTSTGREPISFEPIIDMELDSGNTESTGSMDIVVTDPGYGNLSYVEDPERGSVLYLEEGAGYQLEPDVSVGATTFSDWIGLNYVTYSVWIKPEYIADWGCFLGAGVRTENGFCLGQRQNELWSVGSAAERAPEGEGGGFSYLRGTESPAMENQWSHLVVTYDNRFMRLYLNGELLAIEEKGYNLIWPDDHNFLGLGLGWTDNLNSGDQDYYFTGFMDQAKVWNRALSEQEVSALYQSENHL